MGQEFFIYGLIIAITLSFSIAFNFLLKRVTRLSQKYQRALEIITFLNNSVKTLKDQSYALKTPSKKSFSAQRILRGSLTLKYNGEEADTKAVFRLDD